MIILCHVAPCEGNRGHSLEDWEIDNFLLEIRWELQENHEQIGKPEIIDRWVIKEINGSIEQYRTGHRNSHNIMSFQHQFNVLGDVNQIKITTIMSQWYCHSGNVTVVLSQW